jgi:hypothetical protein
MFPLGRIVGTPGAIEALREAGQPASPLFAKHQGGDWGEMCDEDKKQNDEALKDGGRLMSCYYLTSGVKVWVITEADRSATTILLPSEY